MNQKLLTWPCVLALGACVLNVDTVDLEVRAEMNEGVAWNTLRARLCPYWSLTAAIDPDTDRCAQHATLVVRGVPGERTSAGLRVRGYAVGGEAAVRKQAGLLMQVLALSSGAAPELTVEPTGADDEPFGETLHVEQLRIEMPRARDLIAEWRRGAVDVSDLDGNLRLFDGYDAAADVSDVSSGKIQVAGKAEVTLRGQTELLEIRAGSVELSTRTGSLHVASPGHVRIQSEGSRIELAAGSAEVNGASRGLKGDVTGRADVVSRGPTALRVGGGGSIATSGDAPLEVVVTGTAFERLELRSERGPIRIYLPPAAGFLLELDSAAGVDVKVAGDEQSATTVHAAVGGEPSLAGLGGPRIAASSASMIQVRNRVTRPLSLQGVDCSCRSSCSASRWR